jgi:hypothetical protein
MFFAAALSTFPFGIGLFSLFAIRILFFLFLVDLFFGWGFLYLA